MKYISLFILVALSMVSCSPNPTVFSKRTPSFVSGYVEVTDIKLEQIDNRCLVIKYIPGKVYNFVKKDYKIFDSLSTKHNDKTFNYVMKGGEPGLQGYETVSIDFTSVNISTNKQFNTDVESNDLSDVVSFMTVSPYLYINSSYKSYFYKEKSSVSDEYWEYCQIYFDNYKWTTDYKFTKTPIFPIDKKCSTLTAEDLILIGSTRVHYQKELELAHLYFTELPDVAGDYDITVELVGDNGKTYTATTTMTFE